VLGTCNSLENGLYGTRDLCMCTFVHSIGITVQVYVRGKRLVFNLNPLLSPEDQFKTTAEGSPCQ